MTRALHDAKSMLVKGTEQVISNEDITEMVNRFKSKAYRNYLETAYTVSKFLNRIVKRTRKCILQHTALLRACSL